MTRSARTEALKYDESQFVKTTLEINNTAFLKYIPTTLFTALNNFMHGWLDKANIDLSIQAYINTVFPIIKDYNLA